MVGASAFLAVFVAAHAPTSPAATAAASQARPKQPAPPLFPRHRRGLYRNVHGEEVIDATPQSPPLDTDDPGVPDPGEFEINFTTHVDYANVQQRFDLVNVDVNYGLRPAVLGRLPAQLKIEFPLAAARQPDVPSSVGFGAMRMGLKLNFYRDENRGISIATYPQIEFAAPGGRGVEKGLAETGQTIILPLLVAREFHAFSFTFNGTLEKALHDPERGLALSFGAGLGRPLTRKVAAMIEIRGETDVNLRGDRLVYINGGIIHGVRNVVLFFNLGHSIFAEDGLGHSYAGLGLKLLLDASKKAS